MTLGGNVIRNYALGKNIIFDVLKRQIFLNEKFVNLGGREAAILKLLCEKSNQVISKEEINTEVWGKVFVNETSLTKAISNLRRIFVQFDVVACEIKTIPKEGYMLILEEEYTGPFMQDEPLMLEVKNVIKSSRLRTVSPMASLGMLSSVPEVVLRRTNLFVMITLSFTSALFATMMTTAITIVLR